MNLRGLFVTVLVLSSCTAPPPRERDLPAVEMRETKYYFGTVQRSSMDGKQKYGPEFESIVQREIDRDKGIIEECVWQEGDLYAVEMRREEGLNYGLKDYAGFSKGTIRFEDDQLLAWSYDISVVKPHRGKITGSLADGDGGRVQPDGSLRIKKIWNGNMLIVENYKPISKEAYRAKISPLILKSIDSRLLKLCTGAN